MMDKNSQARARRAAAEAAVLLIEHGMIVGLGTGDTAAYAIRALADRVRAGLRLKTCVPTSVRSADLAHKLGLPLSQLDELPADGAEPVIDITIDGADEIDARMQLVKGAGGALLREKVVAHHSRRLIVVADTTKVVARLGEKRLLPVEIVPFGVPQILARLRRSFAGAELRMVDGAPFRTDGGNQLIDIPIREDDGAQPEALHRRLKLELGVIDTGLFLTEARTVIIGAADGSVERRER